MAREWFVSGKTLKYMPANGTTDLSKASIAGGVLKRVVQIVSGCSHLTLRGLTITHTSPTFLDPYECPSGGGARSPCLWWQWRDCVPCAVCCA